MLTSLMATKYCSIQKELVFRTGYYILQSVFLCESHHTTNLKTVYFELICIVCDLFCDLYTCGMEAVYKRRFVHSACNLQQHYA